jgi:hypothetical protein
MRKYIDAPNSLHRIAQGQSNSLLILLLQTETEIRMVSLMYTVKRTNKLPHSIISPNLSAFFSWHAHTETYTDNLLVFLGRVIDVAFFLIAQHIILYYGRSMDDS